MCEMAPAGTDLTLIVLRVRHWSSKCGLADAILLALAQLDRKKQKNLLSPWQMITEECQRARQTGYSLSWLSVQIRRIPL